MLKAVTLLSFLFFTVSASASQIGLEVRGQFFPVEAENNPTAEKFLELLPLELEMSELNGNEKYFYLDNDLPSNPVKPGKIQAGDLMLYGKNCIVIFYKTFSSSYSYTRLGRVQNSAELESALGKGNADVKFMKM